MTQRNVKLDENVAWTCTNFISCDIDTRIKCVSNEHTRWIYTLYFISFHDNTA